MTTETYQDLIFDRKGQKRPTRPKLLKLTEVTMPHRNRKKTKLKVKERSQSNVRDRFYDDPAYTDDISHLAIPLRRNSGPDKIEASGTFNKRKSSKEPTSNTQPYTKPRAIDLPSYTRDRERNDGSSSSDNETHDYDKVKHVKSIEISHPKIEVSPKKREKRDRSAKQKRNLSLDNNLSNSLRRSLERSEPLLKITSVDRKSKQQQKSSVQRQNASESWNSCIAVTSDSSKATENDESFSGSGRKESKMQIGKKFLKGEIGIKSFNYYLLKEGLKSSKKFVEKKRNSLTWGSDAKKLQSRSEENIYEEIFFVDKNSDNDEHRNKFDDCELCMQECNKENCEFCYKDKKSKKHYFGSLGRHDKHPVYSDARKSEIIDDLAPSIPINAHILEFQSYNPNNPGVFKIETTPVAFTSDYNPISSFKPNCNTAPTHETNLKQISNYARPSVQSQYPHPYPPQSISAYQVPSIQQQQQQQHLITQQLQQHQMRRLRETRANTQINATRVTTKSSSSSDSIHHKFANKSEHQSAPLTTIDAYEYNQRMVYGSNGRIGNANNFQTSQNIYQEPKIYKSDSKASILSEYSIRSESSNRNFRCGEVSDSSIGDSMFSYSTQQKKYFGSSESCRFGFECRRCSLDGEKCSFSDNCRYECRNCDCSSSYFSSDFDDLNYNNPHRRSLNVGSGNVTHNNQRSYEYFNDSFDVKQSKYAQDFFKHVNDVKRSIYQAELQSSNVLIGSANDPFAPIPSNKTGEMKKSMSHDKYNRQEKPIYHCPAEIIINRNPKTGSPYKSSTISHYASTQIFAPSTNSWTGNRSKDSVDYKYKTAVKDYRTIPGPISKSLDEQDNSITSLKRNIKSKQHDYSDKNLNDPDEKYKSYNKSLDKKLLYSQPYRKSKRDQVTEDFNNEQKQITGAIPKLASNEAPLPQPRQHQQLPTNSSSSKFSEYESSSLSKASTIKYVEPKSVINFERSLSPKKLSRSADRGGKTVKEGKIYQKSNIKSTVESGRYLEKSQKEGQKRAKILEKTLQKTPSDEKTCSEIRTKETNKSIDDRSLTRSKLDKKDKIEKNYDELPTSLRKKTTTRTSQSLIVEVRDDDDDVFYDAKSDESLNRTSSLRKNLKSISPPSVPPTTPINISISDIKGQVSDSKISKLIQKSVNYASSTNEKFCKVNLISDETIITKSTSKIPDETNKQSSETVNQNIGTQQPKNNISNPIQINEDEIESKILECTTTTPTKLKRTDMVLTFAPSISPMITSAKISDEDLKKLNEEQTLQQKILQDYPKDNQNSKNNHKNQQNSEKVIGEDSKTLQSENGSSIKDEISVTTTVEKYVEQKSFFSPTKIQDSICKEISPQDEETNKIKIPVRSNQVTEAFQSPQKIHLNNESEQQNENKNVESTLFTDTKDIAEQCSNSNITETNEQTVTEVTSETKDTFESTSNVDDKISTPILSDELITDNPIQTNAVNSIIENNDADSVAASVTNTTITNNISAATATTTLMSADEEISLTKTSTAVGNTFNRELQSNQDLNNSIHRDYKSAQAEFSTLDTSELSTDESFLTKTSTAKSSNELSSTDKIDISDLPLPALPPKKRRSKSRSYRDAGLNYSQLSKNQQQQQQQQQQKQQNLLDPKAQFIAKRRESLEISARNFNEKLEQRKMHFHNMGHMRHSSSATTNPPKPTYLFGEKCYTTTNPNHINKKTSNIIGSVVNDEIYLNKSGWVQVNSKRLQDENYYAHQNGIVQSNAVPHFKNTVRVIQIDNTNLDKQPVYSVPKISGSKIEELISRSEARRNNSQLQRTGYLRQGCKIVDPQLASILNERPGFLPVKTFIETDSPPPITPILSPPPAFQDTKSKYRNDRQSQIKAQISAGLMKQSYHPSQAQITIHHQPLRQNGGNTGGSKGMVFSRSFEYETRKPASDYVEVFSKSFDSNLSEVKPSGIAGLLHRDRSPNFSTLTGNSPNYLTKKESSQSNLSNQQSRDNSPKYQQVGYLNPSSAQSKNLVVPHTKELPPYISSNISSNISINRKLEKPKTYSFDRIGRSRRAQFTRYNQTATIPVSRFRSFDQNINARLNSCDSGARSDLSNDELDNEDDNSSEFLSANYQTQPNFRNQKQRSLTPDKYDSQGSQSSLRKQGSLTPENRSLTPEERRKKGSQASLSSRQNSSSRSNTLERKNKFEDINKSLSASRSSSTSSSYSGGEHNDLVSAHRRSTIRNAKAPEEHRIRRSRSLQLTERSPNRQIQRNGNHQSINATRPSQQMMRNSNFPPTIRPSQIISDPMSTNATIISINSRNNSASIRNANDNIDKSRSFDFDYNISGVTGTGGVIVSNSVNSINQHVGGGRLDFDKSRSFDENYREQSNNLVKSYLTNETISSESNARILGNLLKSGNRSAGGSGSSSSCGGGLTGSGSQQQLQQQQQQKQTSPQNYGTRLCDHELTYDMLRRTLDRSPIMDFSGRVGGGPDYDIPQSMINRETINAGGNSELNFTSDRLYDHGSLTKNAKRLNHSPSESLYSIDRLHSSRDSITPDSSDDRLRSEYASVIYRQQPHRLSGADRSGSSGGGGGGGTVITSRGSINNKTNAKTCDQYPNCGNGSLKSQNTLPKLPNNNIKHTRSKSNKYTHRNSSQRKHSDTNSNSRTDGKLTVSSSVSNLLHINSDDEQLYMNISKKMNNRLRKSLSATQAAKEQRINGEDKRKIFRDLNNKINTSITLHISEDTSPVKTTLYPNPIQKNNEKSIYNNNNSNLKTKTKSSPKVQKKKSISSATKTNDEQQLKENKKLTLKQNSFNETYKNLEPLRAKPPLQSANINYTNGGGGVMKCSSTGNSPKYFKTEFKCSPITASTVIFFGDREMPVTRDSTPINSITSSPTAIPTQFYNSGINSGGTGGVSVTGLCNLGGGSNNSNGRNCFEYESGAKSLEYSGYSGKSLRLSSERQKAKKLLDSNIHQFGKKRSISLPNIFLETKFSSSTLAEDVGDEHERFAAPNLLNRYRAISSPTLNESSSLENKSKNKSDVSPYTTTISVNGCSQNGVFYKFRKTFEHFKQCPQPSIHTSTSTVNIKSNSDIKCLNINKDIIGKNFTHKNLLEDKTNIIQPTIITTKITNDSKNQSGETITTNLNSGGNGGGSFKSRFGASIWRNSKERRKTKFNRRDKCNSGDSGIQIEADNDENYIGINGDDEDLELEITPIPNINIRRSNSARSTSKPNSHYIENQSESFRIPNKRNNMYNSNLQTCGSSSAKSKALKKIQNSENNSAKISPKPKRSLSHPSIDHMTKYADDSDTDSLSSHHDDKPQLFAEVLNQFTPAGPQELALERGALVEIIRQDEGPWWYGKIKHDEIIEKILETQRGWFPKDFVRILNPFMHSENNSFHNEQNHHTTTSIDKYNKKLVSCCDSKTITETENSHNNMNTDISQHDSIKSITLDIGHSCSNSKCLENTHNIDHKNHQSSVKTNILSSQQNSSIKLLETNINDVQTNKTSESSCSINNFNFQANSFVFNTNENLRQNAIKELLETEVNYVKLLSTLSLGYLKEMRKRIDIFSPDSLKIIFSNIEVVLEFQKSFLESLKKGVETNSIAQTFINHQNGFAVYSMYCNSYPRALMELETYSSSKDAKCIFENIRVAQNLSHLPLSAHLLAPIQRICRYPLHLAELVKHTPSKLELEKFYENLSNKNTASNKTGVNESQLYSGCSNCDNKENFEVALNVMKKVTENVNEGKRHSENLNRFQSSFENFQGPPISYHSTRFFMQTDATRISPNLWNNTYTIFLFDHQLIYCKKDILKRNHYIYKGRIFLDSCRILNLPDGKIFGVTLKNALRIFCETLNKWFDFCFRSSSRKLRFLSTLAIERQFCGTNLFVSELVGSSGDTNEDDNYSDREYHSDYDTPTHNSENNLTTLNWKQNIFNNAGSNQQIMIEKYYETLPKKSKKFKKHGISNGFGINYLQYSNNGTAVNSNNQSNQNGSLGRRKLGSWFRKSKSTNTTPNQSPTHNPSSNPLDVNADSNLLQHTNSSPALDGGLIQETCKSVTNISTDAN